MKTGNHLLLLGLIHLILLSSCTIQKRVHSSGYSIEWNNSRHIQQQHVLVKAEPSQQLPQTQSFILRESKVKIENGHQSLIAPESTAYASNEDGMTMVTPSKPVYLTTTDLPDVTAGPEKMLNVKDSIKSEKRPHTKMQKNTAPTNGNSVAGFVLSLVGLASFFTVIGMLVFGILGVIFSAKGLRKSPRGTRGRGLAVAGLVIGILLLHLFAFLVYFILFIA